MKTLLYYTIILLFAGCETGPGIKSLGRIFRSGEYFEEFHYVPVNSTTRSSLRSQFGGSIIKKFDEEYRPGDILAIKKNELFIIHNTDANEKLIEDIKARPVQSLSSPLSFNKEMVSVVVKKNDKVIEEKHDLTLSEAEKIVSDRQKEYEFPCSLSNACLNISKGVASTAIECEDENHNTMKIEITTEGVLNLSFTTIGGMSLSIGSKDGKVKIGQAL